MKTYLQAQEAILDELEDHGWKISSRNLKVRHATNPGGDLRLYFKPQAVYYTTGRYHDAKGAKTLSYYLDIRKLKASEFRTWIGLGPR